MPAAREAASLQLHARHREALPGNTNEFKAVESTLEWNPRKTAIVVCDMWNEHWCKGATRRVGEMAPRMNEVLKAARARGVFIIHCPSDTMNYYTNTPGRKLAQAAPPVAPLTPLQNWCNLNLEKEAPLPIDDADGGCDDEPQCQTRGPWTHEIDTLEIKDGDAITDSAEAYYLMQQRGIENVIVMGVHLNMCVLGRPFSIRQMVAQGKHVVLMRDMTDTMYNSRQRPYVPHCAGTDLMIEHVERYWCPSITSVDFLGGQPFHFAQDVRPLALFMIGEEEYHTWETLPEFAKNVLEWRGIRCEFALASDADKNNFAGLEDLPKADLLVVSVRRRTPSKSQMDLVRQYLAAGKPVVGLRTATHAFGAKPADDQHVGWDTFDVDVFGAHYENHYPAGPLTDASIASATAASPLLTGIPTNGLNSKSSLYRSRSLAPTTAVLLTGRLEDQSGVSEPIAWVNTNANRRVFYTSLGSPTDFATPAFRRLLLNGVLWALDRPIPPEPPAAKPVPPPSPPAAPKVKDVPQEAPPDSHPLSPAASAKMFHVAEDLEFEQVLAEPEIAQPVFLNFDERGRMWVVEYRQYPAPAGLKMVSRDNVWRSVYDKVPPPPPHQFRGADRITIHEDTTGNGVFDKHKIFVEGLNITTAVERGRGGVWVLNPPYLLFYPDANNDDIPDGDPEVRLSGFGIEDTHSVANSLRWGPDGWLYGCQGSTVTGNILGYGKDGTTLSAKPVFSQGQNIWRYHPEQRRFEIFAEGGGNAFGCEIDTQGRIFSGHNGGDTRGFHYDQGAYLQKGFEKHGPLSNPYAFGYFPAMPEPGVQRFTHNFVIYDSGGLPADYNGKLFGAEPLQGRIVLSQITPDGNSFATKDLSYVVTSDDRWFRPVDIKVGPDGAIYVCDWYDQQINHWRNYQGHMDASNGRVYRLKTKGAKPGQKFDLNKVPTTELVALLGNTNKWFRQTALRLLADRLDGSVIPTLRETIDSKSGQTALESFWALNLLGGLNEKTAIRYLDHPDPFIRLWTARLCCDENTVSEKFAAKLAQHAAAEPNAEVRKQFAASARRLPGGAGLALVEALLKHDEDTADNRIPLMLWWAVEANCDKNRDQILSILADCKLWDRPLVQNAILERLMRRFAQAGTRADLITCAQLLDLSPDTARAKILMTGFETAFQGRPLSGLPDPLLKSIAAKGVGSASLQLRMGDTQAIETALKTIGDNSAAAKTRLELLGVLADMKIPAAPPVLLGTISTTTNAAIRRAAIAALAPYDSSEIGATLVEIYPRFDSESRATAQTLLASRPAWAGQLLKAVDSGVVKAETISPAAIRGFKQSKDTELAGLAKKLWPKTGIPTTAEMETRISHFGTVVRDGSGDPYHGRGIFETTCGVCHTLFEHGGHVGPDLTAYQRADLNTMLLNIVNPSAEIREGYETYNIDTKDERSLTGFLADQDNQIVVLRTIDGRNVNIARPDIAEMKASGISLMPEGLLDAMNDQQVRDLFAYLRCTQPLVGNSQ